ncbi:hypothetical protein AADZ90_009005 [Aestuariibius sp. 2305UL40-4]|uniref:hypothetical protein n=1 Tax=Aestuariibius violaceus TaxID=3234132 RepID=UPI00345E6648
MLLTAKILLTVATLGYSAIPTFFDWNASHATNPSWTGHARYHVVWQVSSYDFTALLSLILIWTAGPDAAALWVPALLALAIYGGFWIAWATRPIYGGVLQDKVNGVPDIHYRIFGRAFAVDANVSLFLPLTLSTVAATMLVWGLTT